MAKKCYHVGGSWNNSRIGLEMCEPSTIVYTGGSAFQDKDPENTKKYIRDCTATAAEVVADICIFHGFSVDMISTHAEAYRLGFGSNHGDPDHIWKYIGYSVAQFRKDVQTIINEKGDYTGKMNKAEFEQILDAKFAEFEKKIPAAKADEVVYKFFENVPTWAQPAIKKALDKKYLNGVGTENNKPILNLSADMVRIIVVLNNAGIWDK